MKGKKSKREQKEWLYGLLFASPWILGFLAFSVYPLISSLYYSFTKFNAVTAPKWVGLSNFKDVFSDPLVWKSLLNTLFMAMVAATMVWIWMFDPTYGYINNVLQFFGISGPAWLLDSHYTKWALVLMGTWNTGTTMLVCMAALQSVPNSYYESAEIDGAGVVKRFIYITLPCVAHVIVYQAILSIINSFQYFQQVYIIVTANAGVKGGSAAGGPENSILMYPLYIFHNAFTYLKMGKASAMAWLLFIVVAILTVFMTKVTKKVTEDAGGE